MKELNYDQRIYLQEVIKTFTLDPEDITPNPDMYDMVKDILECGKYRLAEGIEINQKSHYLSAGSRYE